MQELTISSTEFKALASENRVKMLKLLQERNHTLTEVSKKLGMSSPSAKQHLEVLMNSGLIELIDDGRKWKYYSLTRKGKNILQSKENQTQVFILLSVASIAFVAVLAMLLLPVLSGSQLAAPAPEVLTPETFGEELDKTPFAEQEIPAAAGRTQEETTADKEKKEPPKTLPKEESDTLPVQPQSPLQNPLVIIAAVLGLFVIVLVHYYFRTLRVKI